MMTEFRAGDLEVTSEQISLLVVWSQGLFIWSSALIKYVPSSQNPDHEIQQFLPPVRETSEKPFEVLYRLYDQVTYHVR